MRITFIGSSHGIPEPNRKCSCTMVEIKGRYYFIDMGTPAIDHIVTAGIPIDAVKGVFITHMHGDHTNGLIHFVDLISWYFKTSDPTIFLPTDQDFPVIAKERETDLIVCEGAHFYATDYLPHLRECKTKLIYVNHYQSKKIPSILQLAEDMGDIPVKLAYDGREIIL